MTETLAIEVISDTVCPWCFIGKRQLELALGDLPDVEATVKWRPYFLDPYIPKGGVDAKAYLAAKFGSDRAVKAMGGRMREVAEGVGIAFDFHAQKTRPNTLDSHRVIHWAQTASEGVGDAAVEALFSAFFEQGRDIGDRDVLAAIAGDVGLDRAAVRERLESDEDADVIVEQVRAAQDDCVTSVPTFSFDGFLLPGAQEPKVLAQLIRRILDKRRNKT
jgi:predicted DsbA family dithiol-disulfide isomerase